MNTREEALAFGLSFPNTYQESSTHTFAYQRVKVEKSKKTFLLIYEREGYIYLEVKADKALRDLWRSAFSSVIAGLHQNSENWNTIILDETIPDEDIRKMIEASYALVTDSASTRIYEAVKKIPKGKVASYGRIAELAGDKNMARAVGNALHKNPDPQHIPCHRVVNSKGELAGGFAFGGAEVQARLLREEGIEVTGNKVDIKKYGM